MDFPYTSILVYRCLDGTVPLLNELSKKKTQYYCPLKMTLIEHVLIKDLSKMVLEYMGEDRRVYHYFSSEDPISEKMALSIRSRSHIRKIERNLLNQTQKQKAMNQQFDLFVTDVNNLNPVSQLLNALSDYFLKHIHICDLPLQPNYQGAMDLLILPKQLTLWESRTIAKQWVLGNSRTLCSHNVYNDLVVDLRDRKMYYQKPTKHKTKYLEFKSWSFVSLPLK
jgi:hypothetical protein